MKKSIRIALLSGALFIATLGLLWIWYGQQLTTRSFEYLLERLGASEVSIASAVVSLQDVRFQRIRLTWKTTPLSSVDCEITDLRVPISLETLLHPETLRLFADSASVVVHSPPPTPAQPMDPGSIIETLLHQNLPLQQVAVRSVTMSYLQHDQTPLLAFRGKIELDSGTLRLGAGANMQLTPLVTTLAEPVDVRLQSDMTVTRSSAPLGLQVNNLAAQVSGVTLGPAFAARSVDLQFRQLSIDSENVRTNVEMGLEVKSRYLGAAPVQVNTGCAADFDLGDLRSDITCDLRVPLLLEALDARKLAGHVNFSLNFRDFARSKIALPDLELELVGGHVSLLPSTLLFNAPSLRFGLRFESLDLTRILALYPDSHISGSGALEGNSSLEFNRKQLKISGNGSLRARAPGGSLSGDLTSWSDAHPGNRGIALAAKALHNFQYQELAADLNLRADGTLLISAALKGSNPDVNRSQPINVNISIEENIPALMRTIAALGAG